MQIPRNHSEWKERLTSGLIEVPIGTGISIPGNSLCKDVSEYGIEGVYETHDKKMRLFFYRSGSMLAAVKVRETDYHYYQYRPTSFEFPLKAVFFDLDGTVMNTELFWIEVLREVLKRLSGDKDFVFAAKDYPYIQGGTTRDQLTYLLGEYLPGVELKNALSCYYQVYPRMFSDVLEGEEYSQYITAAEGFEDFIIVLKEHHVRTFLVTGALKEKVVPQLQLLFKSLSISKEDAFDFILSGGTRPTPRNEMVGTVGEYCCMKPHPNLYKEAAYYYGNLEVEEIKHSIVIEDSGAGVIAAALAGLPVFGIQGNSVEGGEIVLCNYYAENGFRELQDLLLYLV